MTIREVKRKCNPETNHRERYLSDREFYSLQEIKDYCRSDTMEKRKPTPDVVLYTFMLTDTQEQIDISVQYGLYENNERYIKLDYWF